MSKYNYGFPLKIDSFGEREKLAALKEFAEGSSELEECLITLNNNGLYTIACCRGYHEIDSVQSFIFKYLKGELDVLAYAKCITAPHIAFDKTVDDVFDYLSIDMIENQNVELTHNANGSVITFHGNDCYNLISKFTNDIKTGKKDNQVALRQKVNVKLTVEQLYNSHLCGLVKSGFEEDDINLLKVLIFYNACCRVGKNMSKEEFDNLCLRFGLDVNQSQYVEQCLLNKDANFFLVQDISPSHR